MEVFGVQPQQEDKVFHLPVKSEVIPQSKAKINRDKILYPSVTGYDKETVDAHIDSGLTGPLIAKADVVNYAAATDRVRKDIAFQREVDTVVANIEMLQKDDPFLKRVISPAILAAMKQSEDIEARQFAFTKYRNLLIANEVIKDKSEAVTENIGFGYGDIVDDFMGQVFSDLPVVGLVNTQARKELADRFIGLMNSNESPEVVKQQLEEIATQAADQGFFSVKNNRFYWSDFMGLLNEGTVGSNEALWQDTFGSIDTVLFMAGTLPDAARLLGATGKGKDAVKAALTDAVKMDDAVNGHTVPQSFEESMYTSDLTRGPGRSPTEAQAALEVSLESEAYKEAVSIRRASGQSIDDEAFEAFRTKLVDDKIKAAKESGQYRYIDSKIDVSMDAFENITMKETFGTATGKAFKTERSATTYAKSLGNAQVVKAADGKGWVVQKTTNVPTGMATPGMDAVTIFNDLRLWRTTEADELGSGWFVKHLASPLSQTTNSLNATLKQGEFARARMRKEFSKWYNPIVQKAGKDGIVAVNNVLLDINMGSSAAKWKESWPVGNDFDVLFGTLNKRLPTPAEKELYYSNIHLNDVNFELTAMSHLKREVDKGVEMYTLKDLEFAGIKVNRENYAGAKVWDADNARYVDIDKLPPETTVVKTGELLDFGGSPHDLVAFRKPKTRALTTRDVMGYNAGGPREYMPNRNTAFIKQDNELILIDGRSYKGRPTTIMGTRTTEEARKGTDTINRIIDEVKKAIKVELDDLDAHYDNITKTLKDDPDLNKLIDDLHEWNSNVHDVESLVEFFKSNGLDIRKKVSWAADGDPIVEGDSFVGDLAFKDVMNTPGTLRRGDVRRDKVLLEYGGNSQPIVPPIQSIRKSALSAMARSTNAAYEMQSINGLIRGLLKGTPHADGTIKPLIDQSTIASIKHLPPRMKLKALEGKIFQGSKEGKKFEIERQKILFRLNQQSEFDALYHRMRESFSEFLYGKGFKEASRKIDTMSLDPVAAARGIVFDAYLGLLSMDQFFVQGFGGVMGTFAQSKGIDGLKAVYWQRVVRKTLRNGTPEVIEDMAKRMSTHLGMTPKQAADMMREIQSNGKLAVSSNLADLGEDSVVSGAIGKAREHGRFFYTQGELINVTTAHIAASMDYVRKYGDKADLSSNAARREIIYNADRMTMGMTSTSRTLVEQVPGMQFMSYSMRMTEWLISDLVGGKQILTGRQKVKLLSMMVAVYGANALPGVGSYWDKVNFETGGTTDNRALETIRKGLVDTLIEQMTGVESEYGRRLAWGEGMWTFIQDLGTQTLPETLLGPAYDLSKNALTATSEMVTRIGRGDTGNLGKDLFDIARSIKSVNQYYTSVVAIKTQNYITKKDALVLDDATTAEGLAIAFGVPLERVNREWRTVEYLKSQEDYFRTRAREISSLINELALEYDANGWDTPKAEQLRRSIELAYAIEDPYERMQISKYVQEQPKTLTFTNAIKLMMTNNAAKEQVMK